MFYMGTVFAQTLGCFLAALPLIGGTWLLRKRSKESFSHRVGVFGFCLLVAVMLALSGVPDIFHLRFALRLELRPFVDLASAPDKYIGALLFFIPFGFCLPLLWSRFSANDEAGERVVVAGMLFSFCIEAAQLFGGGTASINDLLMNIAGSALGWGLYVLLCRAVPCAETALCLYESEEDELCEAVWFTQLVWCGQCLIAPWLTLPLIEAVC